MGFTTSFFNQLHLVYQYNAACTVATRVLYCGYKILVVWLQGSCSVATNMLVLNYLPVVPPQDGSKCDVVHGQLFSKDKSV